MSSKLIKLDIETQNKKIYRNFQPKSSSFLEIVYENKKYYLKKNPLLQESHYLKNLYHLDTIYIEKSEEFDTTCLQKVLKMLAGTPLQIKRSQIYSYYPIIKYFQLEKLQNKIQADIYKNFIHYNIFQLIKTAQLCSDQNMFVFCLEQLEKEHFEQLMYNKHEFLQLDPALFKLIIKAHNRFKTNTGKGLDYKDINEILRDYCRIHNFSKECENQLKFESIDLPSLTSQEYKTIFLDELEEKIQNLQEEVENDGHEHFQKFHSFKNQMANSSLLYASQISLGQKPYHQISEKQLRNQMYINYYQKKIKELDKENRELLANLQKIKEATLQNQTAHQEIHQQVERLKNDLEHKKKVQDQYLQIIKKYQDMLNKLQKELDQRTEQIQKLIKEQQFMRQMDDSQIQSIKPVKPEDTLFSSNFSAVSQFLPATLIKQMFSSKSLDSLSNRPPPVPRKKKASLSNLSYQSSLSSIREQQFQSCSTQAKLKFQDPPTTIDQTDYNILYNFLESQGYSNIKYMELVYRRSKTESSIGTPMSIRNKSPLLFLIKIESGEKIGAFMTKSIPLSKTAYIDDKNAFLFSISKQQKLKIKENETKAAINLSQSYLISFGNDLLISKQCQKEKSFCLWPSSYGEQQFTKGKNSSWLTGSSEFDVQALQVYEIIPGKKQSSTNKNNNTIY